jgi:hypothetical protein
MKSTLLCILNDARENVGQILSISAYLVRIGNDSIILLYAYIIKCCYILDSKVTIHAHAIASSRVLGLLNCGEH